MLYTNDCCAVFSLWLIIIISFPSPFLLLLPFSFSSLSSHYFLNLLNWPVYFFLCFPLLLNSVISCPTLSFPLAWVPCCQLLCSHAHYHPFLYFKSQQLPSQAPEHSPVVCGTVESAHLAASTPVTAASSQKQGLCVTASLSLVISSLYYFTALSP